MERHDEVLVCLRKIIRAIDLHAKKLMQDTGLSGPQTQILTVLARVATMMDADQIHAETALATHPIDQQQ